MSADGRLVEALCEQGVDGLVVAGTGNGTLSNALSNALDQASARGVRVLRVTRCASGPVIGAKNGIGLTAVQARVELILTLLAAV